MMLIAFKETHQVQIFESSNGHFTHDFSFYDNIHEQVKEKAGDEPKAKGFQTIDDKAGRRSTIKGG
tara:strand:+ start:552 stop:749 length:198 start_codon:yes stop_codon:yes gene_type:complete